MAYIYQIVNDINDKIYIGKTEFSLEKRFREHCYDAMKPSEEKRPLYSAMRKYGIEHFHIELIEETDVPEERERYWIENKRSFKMGYNATMGGDGKKYIDYDLVIATYKSIGVIKYTAEQLGISPDTVSNILHQNQINILSNKEIHTKLYGKPINMFSLNGEYLRTFPSANEAARYMVDNHLTNCKLTTIKTHITEVCNKKRKTAAKYRWSYTN